MLIKTLNVITFKLSDKQVKNLLCYAFRDTYLEIFSKYDKKIMTIAESSDVKKIFLHISIFAMKLLNIIKVAIFIKLICKKLSASLQKNSIIDNIINKQLFSLRILGMPKFDKKIGSHMRVKKAV